MDYEIENKSCLNCIWHEQCEDISPCEFYDDGITEIDLSSDEIKHRVENNRRKYEDEYWEYVKEYDDGKCYE